MRSIACASRWLPRIFSALKDYSARQFIADVIAGVTVGLVALPLAMAFGIASGMTPEAGIYTAVVAGFIISALGGSRTPDRRPDRRVCGYRCWHRR